MPRFNLLVYQRDFIEPVRNEKGYFLQMRPSVKLDRDDVEFDFDELSFLFDSEDPNLVGEISIAFSKFQAAIDGINNRSKLHIDVIQSKMSDAGFKEGSDPTLGELKEMLGEMHYTTIIQLTDQIISQTDETICYISNTVDTLSKHLEHLYPGRRVLSRAVSTVEKNIT